MDSLDFDRELRRDDLRVVEGTRFMHRLQKKAGVKDLALAALDFARRNKTELIGGSLGAASMAGLHYARSRKGSEGVSSDQKLYRGLLDAAHRKPEGERGFAEDMGAVVSRLSMDMADLSAKYPVTTALLMAAPIGGSVGRTVAKKIF
jgi:hypothetical protein